MNYDIKEIVSGLAADFEPHLESLVCPDDCPVELADAMKYAVLAGGKRLRPAMVRLAADLAAGEGNAPPVDPTAAQVAIELVHGYSLVHDDLPAMDDDTLRRGRPTLHVRYGEAMAILVGDALLTRAFELLAGVRPGEVAAALAMELARGAGPAGMIAGQVADMELCALADGVAGLDYIHARKTAALFAASARMGAICGGGNADVIDKLGRFAFALGMAFQVTDDILDATSTAQQLGKTPGKDQAAGKRTYPALLGLEASRTAAETLSRQAADSLESFGPRGGRLAALAELLLGRTR